MPEIDEDNPTPHPIITERDAVSSNRLIIGLLIVLLTVTVTIGGVTAYGVYRRSSENTTPIIAELPQSVNGRNADASAVEDVVKQGDTITITSTKVNTTKKDALTFRIPSLVQQDGDERRSLPSGAPIIRAPGPSSVPILVTIPADLPPGLWRVEGDDLVVQDHVTSLQFYSETFRVVARGQ